ncbi:MAG: Nitrilotriacetate monooxygenase component A, partial [uncultured Solirubrobacteraceae bacterium]
HPGRGAALLRRREGAPGPARARPRPPEDPARLLRRGGRDGGRGAGEAGAARRPRALRERGRVALDRARRGRFALRPGRAAARHPRNRGQQERAGAGDRAGAAGGADRAPARPAARRLSRPGHGGDAGDDRRRDGGVADDGRLRRVQRHVPLPARRLGRLRRSRGAGVAAAGAVPARVRRRDAARKPRPAPAREPVLPDPNV